MSANAKEQVTRTWNKQPDDIRKIYDPHQANTILNVLPDMLNNNGSTPERALQGTLDILARKRWKPMELLGKDVKPMGIMRRLLSDSALESMMRAAFKIPSYKG